MGRRIQKKVYTYQATAYSLQSNHLYIYDGWNLVEETTEVGAAQTSRYFVWGQDLSQSLQGAGGIGGLIATVDGSAAYLYCFDANGNVGQVVNTVDGAIAAGYEYDPYGKSIKADGAYADDNPFRFSTKYHDDETGLVYYGYRYYSAELGRWLSKDPIGHKGGLNLYGFLQNNSLNNIDPNGLYTYLLFIGDPRTYSGGEVPFQEAANVKKSEIEASGKDDKAFIVNVRRFSEIQWALKNHKCIKGIYFYAHSSVGMLHLDMYEDRADTNISCIGSPTIISELIPFTFYTFKTTDYKKLFTGNTLENGDLYIY